MVLHGVVLALKFNEPETLLLKSHIQFIALFLVFMISKAYSKKQRPAGVKFTSLEVLSKS